MIINKKGFTLVEAVVTIVVLSILAFIVLYIMVEGFRVWSENINYIELRSDARFALTRLSAEFRHAESVTATSETDITFSSDFDNTGALRTIRYYLNGTNLYREESGDVVICGNVSGIDFSWNSPLLTVDITLLRQGDVVRLNKDIMARCLP